MSTQSLPAHHNHNRDPAARDSDHPSYTCVVLTAAPVESSLAPHNAAQLHAPGILKLMNPKPAQGIAVGHAIKSNQIVLPNFPSVWIGFIKRHLMSLAGTSLPAAPNQCSRHPQASALSRRAHPHCAGVVHGSHRQLSGNMHARSTHGFHSQVRSTAIEAPYSSFQAANNAHGGRTAPAERRQHVGAQTHHQAHPEPRGAPMNAWIFTMTCACNSRCSGQLKHQQHRLHKMHPLHAMGARFRSHSMYSSQSLHTQARWPCPSPHSCTP